MGFIAHHAVIVTSYNLEDIKGLQARARELGACVSEVSPMVTNRYYSFCVFPDGSKEGWEDSKVGDTVRHQVIEGAQTLGMEWVEVCFGRDIEEPFCRGRE